MPHIILAVRAQEVGAEVVRNEVKHVVLGSRGRGRQRPAGSQQGHDPMQASLLRHFQWNGSSSGIKWTNMSHDLDTLTLTLIDESRDSPMHVRPSSVRTHCAYILSPLLHASICLTTVLQDSSALDSLSSELH